MDDNRIILLLTQRAEAALTALEEKYGRRLYTIAINILGNAQDAQECVNDTYMALWNTIPPEKPDPLCAYAFRISRNTALNRLRRDRAWKRDSSYDLSLDELTECIGQNGLEDTLDGAQLGDAINAFLGTLSRENRIIFLRRHWFGDSVKDIAADLKLAENAVSVRLTRTRIKLKDYLTREGFL